MSFIKTRALPLGHSRKSSLTVSASQIFLFLLFMSIYLKIHGGGIVHIAAFLCALVAATRYKKIIQGTPYLVAFGGLLALQILYIGDITKDSIRFSVYMMTNMVTIVSGLVLLSNVVRLRSGSTLMIVMYIMLGLAILEVFFGLKPAFDIIRSLYTSDTSLYEAIDRDIQQYGQIRPAVFTSEPSSLGNFFGAIWLSYCCIIKINSRNALKAIILISAAMFVFRSPTLIGYLAVAPGLIMVRNNMDKTGYIYLAALFAAVTIGMPYFWSQRHLIPSGPMQEFFSTGSFFIRQISPLLTVERALETAPILGLGSKFHETSQEVSMVFLSLFFGGYYTPDFLSLMPARNFSSNALWELVGTLGIGGIVCFLALLGAYLLHLRVKKVPAVLLGTLILLINHAGIALTFSWVHLLLLAYAFMDSAQKKVV